MPSKDLQHNVHKLRNFIIVLFTFLLPAALIIFLALYYHF